MKQEMIYELVNARLFHVYDLVDEEDASPVEKTVLEQLPGIEINMSFLLLGIY